MDHLRTLFGRLSNGAFRFSTDFVPRLGTAIIVLLVGWIAAALGRKLVYLGLRALGVDVFFERLGGDRLLAEGRVRRRPSQVAGVLTYGIVWLFTILVALDVLGMDAASSLLEDLLDYIPRLFVAVVMLGLGFYLAEFTAGLIGAIALTGRVSFNRTVEWMIRIGLMSLVLLAVAEQLGIASSFVIMAFGVILGGAVLTIVLSVGLGGTETARGVLAGFTLRMHVHKGSRIDWQGTPAVVCKLGLVACELESEGKVFLVNNSDVLASRITILPAETP